MDENLEDKLSLDPLEQARIKNILETVEKQIIEIQRQRNTFRGRVSKYVSNITDFITRKGDCILYTSSLLTVSGFNMYNAIENSNKNHEAALGYGLISIVAAWSAGVIFESYRHK